MIRIAIVEDEEQASRTLTSVLKLYAKKENLVFSIALYKNAESFLVETSKAFDIVFFDIELPGISGMDAAFKLRESDSSIIIIFVTNMAQYAVRGYEVDALYYIIKPFTYQKVEYKLKKAMAILKAETNTNIILRQINGIVRLSTKNLMYIEVVSHKLIYHMDSGTFTASGSLADLEGKLKDGGFFRCNNCYLVNANYIASVASHTVTLLDGTKLQISHPRKKQFMIALGSWLGEGNI